jgi:hypothetical protein
VAAKQRLALSVALLGGDAKEVPRADLQCRRTIAQRLRPRRQTRILLVFSRAPFESEPANVLKQHLRDHLGHILVYVRNAKAPNDCRDAQKELRMVRAAGKRLAPRAKRKTPHRDSREMRREDTA